MSGFFDNAAANSTAAISRLIAACKYISLRYDIFWVWNVVTICYDIFSEISMHFLLNESDEG